MGSRSRRQSTRWSGSRSTAGKGGAARTGSDSDGPAPGDLVGVGTATGTIRDELIELRDAVRTVQSSLDEVLGLLRTGTVDGLTPEAAAVELPPPIDEADEPPEPEPERRRRRLKLPILILIAVVVGLLIAGAAILVSMVGWNELRSETDARADVLSIVAVAFVPAAGSEERRPANW